MGMFKMCAEGGFPICPIAMEYRNPEVAWEGSDLFVPHALRVFRRRYVDVALRFGEVQYGDDMVELRERLHVDLRGLPARCGPIGTPRKPEVKRACRETCP